MVQSSRELKRMRVIDNIINLLFISQTQEEMYLIGYYKVFPKTKNIPNIMEKT